MSLFPEVWVNAGGAQICSKKWDQLRVPCKSIHHDKPVNGLTRPIFTLYVRCVCGRQKATACKISGADVTYLPIAADVTFIQSV